MTTIGRPNQLQAAAIPLRRRDLRAPTQGRRLIQDPLEDRLWAYYDTVPAIGNYVQTLSNSADLVHYYPGLIDPDAAEPVEQTTGPVADLWEEIGGEAAMSEWVSQLVVHLSVTGQGWFVPLLKPNVLVEVSRDETIPTEEVTWTIVSTADLKRLLKVGPDSPIPEDDNRIWRMYTPHPKNSRDPDSPVRRVQTQAEILTLIERRRIADLHSRIHAGVWFLPSTLNDLKTRTGKGWADQLEEGLIASTTPGALEALVPMLAWVDREELAAVKEPIRLTLDDTDKLNELQEQTLKQLAIGLDAPQELTTGMNSLNHWGAWLVQEATYTQHLDPLIVRILRSFEEWWQAQIAARSIPNVEDHVIWRNPATAINRPDTFGEAKDLHAAFVISDDALRRAADRDDSDKPSDEEIARRIEIQRLLKTTPAAPSVDQIRNTPDTNPIQSSVQAATFPDLDRLARRLTNIDASTLQRLENEAAKQLRKRRQSLLDRIAAGAKNRGMNVDDPETLPIRLGPSVVQELIPGALADPDDFDPAPFTAILADAQTETAAVTEQAGATRDLVADREDRNTAVAALLAALAGALAASLFKRPDTTGEVGIDGAEWVPTNQLRTAMDLAGGGLASRGADEAWELIGNGKRTNQDLDRIGITTEGFRWVYGSMPRRVFEPHRDLDGFTFTRWDDPELRQTTETWVGGEFWFPGDHRGCGCSYVRIMVPVRELISV